MREKRVRETQQKRDTHEKGKHLIEAKGEKKGQGSW